MLEHVEVVSESPLRVASFKERNARGSWSLTVVCKATLVLVPGEMRLAEAAHQDDPVEADAHWDDDPNRSLYAASDLVASKRHVDVVLVGWAFAPAGRPVTTLDARLRVGSLDKRIRVVGDRPRDGASPSEFTRMPIVYERAAFGPENPVGVRERAGGPLPNLSLVAQAGRPRDGAVAAFGPVAATWPQRAAGDASQSAPRDQRLARLGADEIVTLEHLTPDHPTLATRLPGLRPGATLELEAPRALRRSIALTCDALCFDTARGVATLTWRATIGELRGDERGRVAITLGRSGIAPLQNDATVDAPSHEEAAAKLDDHGDQGDYADSTEQILAPRSLRRAPLPFVDDASSPSSGRPLPFKPAAIAQPLVSVSVPAPAPVRPPLAPVAAFAPPVHAPLAPPAPPASALGASNAATASAAAGGSAVSAVDWAPVDRGDVSGSANAPRATSHEAVVDVLFAPVTSATRVRAVAAWDAFLREAAKRAAEGDLRPDRAAVKASARKTKPEHDLHDPAAKAARARAELGAILSRGPLDAGELARLVADPAGLDAFARAGGFEPPVLALEGELAFAFDAVEALRATVAAAASFAPGEKRLEAAIAAAGALLDAHGAAGAAVAAERCAAEVRAALAAVKAPPPRDWITGATIRALVEGRRYARLAAFGERVLRATLTVRRGDEPTAIAVPVFVPEAAEGALPLFAAFAARVVVEAHHRQHEADSAPITLRLLALGRLPRGLRA